MKKILPGLVIGGICAIVIFATQVVFPHNGTDNMWVVLAAYLLIFLSLFAAGFWYKITGGTGGGIRVGSITGIVVFLMIAITYVAIDNIYLSAVSRQTEKIWGFAHSRYPTMRAYINWNLLKGSLLGLPLFAFFGAVFGGMGGVTAAYFFRKHVRRFTVVAVFLRRFFPYAAVITALTALLPLSGLIKTGYQLLTGWILALVTVFFALIIIELLRRNEKRQN